MLADQYNRFINWIGDGTGLPDTVLHLHAGLLVLMLARIVTGRSLGSMIPWLFVLAAETFNEVMDRLHFGNWRWHDTIGDMATTLFWPTVICLGVRFRPLLPRAVQARPMAGRDES